ncbi:MAG: DUF4315 family protein [Lachnospiraceae bacterium]|nr:DUF4315 family protein [Clostridiales bacterium]MCD8379168.1 DUF4315 family protein [Lachnospiraceae bacterium]
MNKKIDKVREEIRKTEKKIRELEEYLKTQKDKERQLVDEEIVSQIRSMQEKGGDVLEVLRMVQDMKTSAEEKKKESEEMEHEEQ